MDRHSWPAALALISLVILGTFLIYTERIVREVRTKSEIHSRMYALVQQGLLSMEPGADLQALIALQATLTELGVPVVAVNAQGEPYAVANLPFEVDLSVAADREAVLAYARVLDRQNPAIHEPGAGTVHFGQPPILAWLRWAPILQIGAALVLLMVGFGLVRSNNRAERERTWAAMARELAHQMGTPLSSLTGWVEVLTLPDDQRTALASTERIAREIGTDVDRLERVSRRFELIGKPPALEPVPVDGVLDELERYLRPRLPRLTGGVSLRIRVQPDLPWVRANRVLLVWALENLVKNSLDALAGRRGGRIRVVARSTGPEGVRIQVSDNGPGIVHGVREKLFRTGVTTKVGGWGVGLSLTRRIIEDLHDGRIRTRQRKGGGAIFEIVLPTEWHPSAGGENLADGAAMAEREDRSRVFMK